MGFFEDIAKANAAALKKNNITAPPAFNNAAANAAAADQAAKKRADEIAARNAQAAAEAARVRQAAQTGLQAGANARQQATVQAANAIRNPVQSGLQAGATNKLAEINAAKAAEQAPPPPPPAAEQSAGTQPAAPPSPPAAMTPQQAADLAKTQLADDMKVGEDFANKHFSDGALGRMNDPRQAEMNALLAKLAARQDGMTPDELRAASEQGTAAIDAQLAQNQRKLASIAGANGLRGGAAGGLQMSALNEATGQRAQLARQLVLDNLAQKSQNLEQYGKVLTGQQGTELGIQDRNLDLKGQEAFGRASTPLQISGVLDSSRQGILANDLAKTNVDIAKEYVKNFKETGGYGGKGGTQAKGDEVGTGPYDGERTYNDAAAASKQWFEQNAFNTGVSKEQAVAQYEQWAQSPRGKFMLAHGYSRADFDKMPAALQEQYYKLPG